jgi:Tol biopolymer transport system component
MDVEKFDVAATGPGIAYRGDLVTDGVQDVFHVTLSQGQAGTTRRVTDATSAHVEIGGPWLSPDGARLLFTSGNSPTQALDPFGGPVPGHLAHVVNLGAQSPAPARIGAADGHVQIPVWTKDGARVLAYRQPDGGAGTVQGGSLVLLDATTGAATTLNTTAWDGASVDIAYRPGG